MLVLGQRSILFLVGTFAGFYLGLHLRKCQTTKTWYSREYMPTSPKTTLHVHLKPLLIGVISSEDNLQSKLSSAIRTWIQTIQGDVKIFSENLSDSSKYLPLEIIYLPSKLGRKEASFDQKSLNVISNVADSYAPEYEWFAITDDATYIHGDKLNYLISSINSSKVCYFGKLDFKNHEISVDNSMVVVSQAGLLILNKHIKICFSSKKKLIDCIKKYIKKPCIHFNKVSMLSKVY